MKEQRREERWRRLPVLPEEVYQVWQKEGGVLNPSSVIATIDEDGAPRTAPFGSLHAISPDKLLAVMHRYHDSLKNIKRDGRVMVCMISAPDSAISVRGMATVAEEPWSVDERYALVEITIHEVKNDMPMQIGIESGITIAASGPFQQWWKTCWEILTQTDL
jgi:flavin reductase (DIM6/NTAB) family NADH-FMN oxidoreductase RutF